MIEDRPLSRNVAARTKEFFEARAPWQRRLWEGGLILTMHELVEACEAQADGHLSRSALEWFSKSTAEAVLNNPAPGTMLQRVHLKELLQSCPSFGTYKFEILKNLASDISLNYFERWASALQQENHGYNAERISRALASAVLDAGASARNQSVPKDA